MWRWSTTNQPTICLTADARRTRREKVKRIAVSEVRLKEIDAIKRIAVSEVRLKEIDALTAESGAKISEMTLKYEATL